MSVLIKTEKLSKTYPMGDHSFQALKDIDLEVKSGEFTGFVGPSGSGKTTLLNMVGALDSVTDGKISVLGHDLRSISSDQGSDLRARQIGFIFQSYYLLPVFTVYENVEFPLLLLDMPAAERKKAVVQAVEWVGLMDKLFSKPGQLSGGQCQRVAIARAMVKEPELVIADEPTANLDSENSHMVLSTMAKLNKELNTTFLFSTHDEKVIGYLKRVITLADGVICKDESK